MLIYLEIRRVAFSYQNCYRVSKGTTIIDNLAFTTWHILFYYINPRRVTKLNHLRMIAEYCVGRRSALRAVPLDTQLWFSQQKVTPDLGSRPVS